MHVGVDGLGVVVTPGVDEEAVVGVDVSDDISKGIGTRASSPTSPCRQRAGPIQDPRRARDDHGHVRTQHGR